MKKKDKMLAWTLGIVGIFIVAVLVTGGNFFSIAQFPNMYQGSILECTSPADGEPGRYCQVNSATSNKVNGQTRVVSEGTVTADREALGGKAKIYYTLVATPEDCSKSASITVHAYNYGTGSYDTVFSESASNEAKHYVFDANDETGSGLFPATVPSDPWSQTATSGRGYPITYGTYKGYDLSQTHLDSDQRTAKFKLIMEANGYCGKVATSSVPSIHVIWNYKDGTTGTDENPDVPVVEDPVDKTLPSVPSITESDDSRTMLVSGILILAISGMFIILLMKYGKRR